MADMSFTAEYSGQAPSTRYTSHQINRNTVAYTPHPQQGSAGGNAVSESPRYAASNSNINHHESLTGTFANVSDVVPLHQPGYNSHYRTQQSQGTSETSLTPTSGVDGTPAHTLDDLPQSYPMIGGEGHQELSLQGLDQNCQGYPIGLFHSNTTEYAPHYDLISAKGSVTKQPNTVSFDTLRELIPRSVGEPFSDLFPRVGNPSPGLAIMVSALKPDPYLNAFLQQATMYSTEYCSNHQVSSSVVDDSGFVEESASTWQHQMPEPAFDLPYGNDHSHLTPSLARKTSRSHSVSRSPSQMPIPSSLKSKRGRRHGFRFSRDDARNAKDTRQVGSCWHCYVMKIKCSPGTPCDACQGILSRHGFRTWPLSCFRKLEDLTDHFFPDALVGHLDEATVLKFCTDNMSAIVRDDFEIRLTAGYGEPFLLDALTFIPANNTQLTYGLGVVMNEELTASSRVWHTTPFISLQLVSSGLLLNQVQIWLDKILFSNIEGWPDFSYGRFSWQRGIFQAICRFFTSHVHTIDSEGIGRDQWSGRPKMLRKALELSILTFVMSHQLLIPEDEKSRLSGGIYIPQDVNVSCRLPNKIFKMQLLPMLKRVANDVLTELHFSLRNNKDATDWGFDFSVMMLLLTVVAENQISLDDVVACAIDRGDLGRSREVDAMADIKALESNLSDVLIKLYDKKYKSRGDSFNPFQVSHQGVDTGRDEIIQQLVRDISSVIDSHPCCLAPWPGLDDMHPDQLYPYNVARLLLKFLGPFFESSEGQNQHRSMVVGKRHKQQPSRP